MKTGIIGAGRVGCSLGKYFRSKGADLVGYYDTSAAAAKEAAAFTQTADFDQVQQLVRESDLLFITTPDSLLVPVWEEIKGMSHRNQIICHCSGALSSDSFSGAKEAGVSCCSVHPMLPFSNKFSSYQQLEHAFFTVEGHPHAVQVITDLLTSYGNEVCRIDAAAKPEYHAAASILSNQVIAVLDTGYRLLEDCGFPVKSRCGNCCTGPSEHRKCALAGLCPCTDRSDRARGCLNRGKALTLFKHRRCRFVPHARHTASGNCRRKKSNTEL